MRIKLLSIDLFLSVMSLLLPFLIHWRLITPNSFDRLYIHHDVTNSTYPSLVHLTSVVRQGQLPVWNWHVYSGMYEGGAFYNTLLYPLNIPFFLGLLDPAKPAIFNSYLLFHLGLGAVGFYILARSLRFHPYLSFTGATLYGLSFIGVFSLITGSAFLLPFAWFPFVLTAFRVFAYGGDIKWALWGGVAWLLCLLSANPITIVPLIPLLIVWLLVWGLEAHRRGRIHWCRFASQCGLALALGVGLWLGQAIPLWESLSVASRNSIASYEWVRQSWAEQKGFVVLFRDLLFPRYQGALYVSIGAVGTPLFVLGLWMARSNWERVLGYFTLITAMVLFLPSALVVYDFAYLVAPLVNRINAIDRGALAFVIPVILMALSGVRTLQRSMSTSRAPSLKWWATGLIIFYAAAFFLFAVFFKNDVLTRESFQSLSLHMMLFSAAGLFTLHFMVRRPRSRSTSRYIFILALISILDVSALARNYFFVSHGTAIALRENDSVLARYKSSYLPDGVLHLDEPSIGRERVNMPRNQTAMLQSLDNVGGYYQFQPRWVSQAFMSSSFQDSYLFRGPHDFDTQAKWPQGTIEQLYDIGPNRKGRAFPVPIGIQADSAKDILITLQSSQFDSSKELLFQNRDGALQDYPYLIRKLYGLASLFKISPPVTRPLSAPIILNDSTLLLAQGPAYAGFKVETDSAFFFFSNSWHPVWTAYVNGVAVPVLRANYAFMAVELPRGGGQYLVEFVCVPLPYYFGLTLSFIFFVALLTVYFKTRSSPHKQVFPHLKLRRL